ncbi:hypothetical protein [Deefgea piscis]|uniref:hypothetical protein n=1 Tax=Deefgea piscis TaxID=2739061 RepID=UPI001C80A5E5|nr:hypothetical protein [Deefgea piscis]QZA80254.1 hypothetical protein K4H25_12000 [Deefgea piscis]
MSLLAQLVVAQFGPAAELSAEFKRVEQQRLRLNQQQDRRIKIARRRAGVAKFLLARRSDWR